MRRWISASGPETGAPSLLRSGWPLPLVHRGALVLSFALLAVLATRQVGSLDIGFHLKAGERILQGQGWPRTDPFTFTVTDHAYVDTSWGYQVLVAALQRSCGAGGLVLLHLAFVLAVFVLLYRSARLAPVDPTSLVLLLLAGGIASEMRFQARPELLSWFFLALVLHLLHRRALGLPSPLWALAAIHLVWANAHSLFILGWGALLCFLAGTWLETRRVDRALLGWSLASVAITLVNPYGWRGVTFPFTLATRFQEQNLFSQSIGEFISPFALKFSEQFPFYPRLPINLFRILAVLGAIALVPLFRRRRFRCCFLYLAFLPLGAMMVRNMPLLVVAGLPGTVWGLSDVVDFGASRLGAGTRRLLRSGALAAAAVATVVLGLLVVHDAYYIATRRLARFGLGWNRLELPVDAARAAASMGLDGPVLNHLNFGGYLMWARPQPVFIDGRLEVMGEEFYAYYKQVLAPGGDLESCASRFGIQWLVFPHAWQPGLLARLSKDTHWRLAYVDHLAVIFVREGAAARSAAGPSPPAAPVIPILTQAVPVAALPGIGGNPRPDHLTHFLSGLVRSQEYPSEDFYLGLFHYERGELEQAERRFASAIQKSDGAYYEIYNNLAAVLYRERRFKESADCYRLVAAESPGKFPAQKRLSPAR